MKCNNCNYKIKKDFNICPKCGSEIIKTTEAKKINIKLIALFTAVLLIITSCSLFFVFRKADIESIRESVLKINVYDENNNLIQTGSGFVIYKKNILITNAHVIEGGHTAEAISEKDERVFIQGALYYSTKEDIAILKLNNQDDIKPLDYTTTYKVGDDVIAIGSPLGIKNSVSDGVISNIVEENKQTMIQHTAPISSGSSGGVLFNDKGKVIGMNSASYTDGQNMNLAIPIETINKAYKKCENNSVETIKNIQIKNSSDVKSKLFDSTYGEEILNETIKLTSGDFATRNKISDFKSIPSLQKIYNEKSNIELAYIFWGIDDRENDIETPLHEVVIIKCSDIDDSFKSKIKSIFAERADLLYEFATADNVDRDFEYSKEYIDAIKNHTIGFDGNYSYFIVTKDETYKNKIVELIKKLP